MSTAPAIAGRIRLAGCVRLRREHFGGLAFDPRTGSTVELDRGALRLLELAQPGVDLEEAWEFIVQEGLERRRMEGDISAIIQELLALGILDEADEVQSLADGDRPPTGGWPAGPPLTGPEVVHWAVTYRCHAGCPDCYAARHRSAGAVELSTDEASRLVDRVAELGAFQLAVGGGEPLLREDLPALLRRARDRGLCVHVTTSGETPGGVGDAVLESLTCLQIGVRPDDLLGPAATARQRRMLPELWRRAGEHGVVTGANLMLCRAVAGRLEEAVDRLVDTGISRVTLLRYKPPASVDRWLQEAPEPAELLGLEDRVACITRRHPDLSLRLDCALSFLERHLPPDEARRAGLRGCVVGSRILALGPDGSAYPCSQLVAPRFCAGNILEAEPVDIWRESTALRRFRNRRGNKAFRRTLCGACRAVQQCGGCAALSADGHGADPGCPEPLPPPLSSLGRDGRAADLGRYLGSRPDISVGEYMDRYGVGQRRAVSELRRFPGLAPAEPEEGERRKRAGGRKRDRFELVGHDLVGEVQDMIGATPAGFPYATREEIAKWIGLPAEEAGYPAWLLSSGEHPTTTPEGFAQAQQRKRDLSTSGKRRRRR